MKQPPYESMWTQIAQERKVLRALKTDRKLVSIIPQSFSIWCCKPSWKLAFRKPGGAKPTAQTCIILRCLSSSINIWRTPVIAIRTAIHLFLWIRSTHYSIIAFWHSEIYVGIILNNRLTPYKLLTV